MNIMAGSPFHYGSVIQLACSRRSDSGARAKNKASERVGKNEGRLGERTRERL